MFYLYFYFFRRVCLLVKRVILAMFLAFTMLFIVGQDNQAEAHDGYVSGYVINIRTYLSIREYPSTYSQELARISNGTYIEVDLYRRSGDFYFVYVPSYLVSGWAHRAYISF